jgi:hypothetical protein
MPSARVGWDNNAVATIKVTPSSGILSILQTPQKARLAHLTTTTKRLANQIGFEASSRRSCGAVARMLTRVL